nr:exodeoxyribonuclease VII small subunit [Iocasia fonsfrigidae]
MSENEMKFEKALEKLEDIVEKLESGGLSLDESLEKFTEGVKLIKFCNQELAAAEEKIEIVLKEADDLNNIVPYKNEEEIN